MSTEDCCNVNCENPLDQSYWEAQYQNNTLGWDVGKITTPIREYIDTIEDKNIRIIIPGCGNSYEAEYLLQKGFTSITVIDIAPSLIQKLQHRFSNHPNITIVLGDFFEHQGIYDLVLEQTFFCALPPFMRQKYVWKMHQLLSKKGVLAGLLFDTTFEVSPPFGGSKLEYELLFKDAFRFLRLEPCTNSIPQRATKELFFEFKRNNLVEVNRYSIEGVSCDSCSETISRQLAAIEGVLNVRMSTNFLEVLIVSSNKIALTTLQNAIHDEKEYRIAALNE